jgi:hypothetical protein
VSDNLQIVRDWHEAATFSREDDLLALTHPDFVMTEASVLPGAVTVRGVDALLRYSKGWAHNWSEWEWQEHELFELPPHRVVFDTTLRLKGRRSALWVEHRWVYLIEIRDGLVWRNDGFDSREEMEKALQESAPG